MRKKGRKRALTPEQVDEVREAWMANVRHWQRYRSNPNHWARPENLSMSDLAARYRVSHGVIQHVIDRKGAYA